MKINESCKKNIWKIKTTWPNVRNEHMNQNKWIMWENRMWKIEIHAWYMKNEHMKIIMWQKSHMKNKTFCSTCEKLTYENKCTTWKKNHVKNKNTSSTCESL